MDWVARGHSLLVIAQWLENFRYGPISSNQTVFNWSKEDPFVGISFEKESGELIDFCGPQKLEGLFKPILQAFRYTVIFSSDSIIPLLCVSKSRHGSDQIVGGVIEFGQGTVLFIPPTAFQNEAISLPQYVNLAGAPEAFRVLEKTEKLPAWASSYQTESEHAAQNKIAELDAKISELRSGAIEQHKVVEAAQSLKRLFTATDNIFAEAVCEVMRELGLKIIEGPPGRADLIAYDGSLLWAFEVKGLEGSARENNLRQTERWVADINSALTASDEQKAADRDLYAYAQKIFELGLPSGVETECKGVMVIGTYRKTPIDQRTKPDFPVPTERAINRSNVCALTGLQLLGILLETRKNPATNAEILGQMRATNGVLNYARDWRAFLKMS